MDTDMQHVTWQEYNDDIYNLKQQIETQDKPHLVTLYRGGLPMGTHLSNILDIPLSIIDFQSYHGEVTEAKIIKNAGISAENTLVLVDDIFDKGLTIAKSVHLLRELYPNNKLKIYTLYNNNHMSHLHDNYAFEVISLNRSNGLWISFPWESV